MHLKVMKHTILNYDYKIRIIKLGEILETSFFLKTFLNNGFDRQTSFMLRTLPVELPKTMNISDLVRAMASLETFGNKIEIVEREVKTSMTNSMVFGSYGESRIVYTTGIGFTSVLSEPTNTGFKTLEVKE